VPVRDGDDESTLAARVLAVEHILLPRVVRWYCEGRLAIEGRRVHVRDLDTPSGGKWCRRAMNPAHRVDDRCRADASLRFRCASRSRRRWRARAARSRSRSSLSLLVHLALTLWPRGPSLRRIDAAHGDDHRTAAAACAVASRSRSRRQAEAARAAARPPRRNRSHAERRAEQPRPKPRAVAAGARALIESAPSDPGAAATGKTLPPRVDLAYKVFWGTRGFLIGDAVYRFEHKDQRYRIATVGEARGLAALVLRGQGKLESRGVITEDGLQPSILRIERGGPDRVETAVFDWEAGMVTMHDNKTAPLDLPTFDPLSLMWQYYFTPPTSDQVTVTVATPRRLVRYTISREGTETIEWPHGPIATERWHRRSDDGKTDAYIWLAPSLRNIPVKIRVSNTERGTIEVVLDSIRVDEDAAAVGRGRPGHAARPSIRPPRAGLAAGAATPGRDLPTMTGQRPPFATASCTRSPQRSRKCGTSLRRRTRRCPRSFACIASSARATRLHRRRRVPRSCGASARSETLAESNDARKLAIACWCASSVDRCAISRRRSRRL
jgi:hypothetical protein